MDNLLFAFKNLFKKPFRATMTILSIAIGVTAVLVINLVSSAGKEIINQELDDLGINGITVSIEDNAQNLYLSDEDLEYVKTIQNVADASPLLTKNGYIYRNAEQISTAFWGVGAGEKQVFSLKAMYGRLIGQGDILGQKNVCVVDANTAEECLNRKNCVGSKLLISINGISEIYTVIGVATPNSGILETISGDVMPSVVYLPYTTLQAKLGTNAISQITVRLNEEGLADLDNSIETIKKSLSLRVSAEDLIEISNMATHRDKLLKIVSYISVTLAIIGAISLVVAGIGVTTLMLVSVGERKKEIGIKKALGAKSGTIMKEFFLESIILSFIGSLIALLLTGLIAWFATGVLKYAFTIQFGQIALTVGVAFGCGMVFGVYPALKASKLNPVETLKGD